MATEMLTRSSLAANSAAPGFSARSPRQGVTEQGDEPSPKATASQARENNDLGFKSTQVQTVRFDDASFGDFLNMFNPLNMIPGVSTLNAAATGQKTPALSSLIGGAIFGGPIGVVMAGMGMMFEGATGKGMLGSVADAVTGKTEAPQQLASARYQSIANANKQDYHLWTDNA